MPQVSTGNPASAFRFDGLAREFDRRAGLPPAAVEAIAAAVLERAGSAGNTGWLVDFGAGTGEIGARLAAVHPRYLGVDLSLPMLLCYPAPARRIQADGGAAWPLKDGSVGTLFFSRAAHLLPLEHLAAEAERVARSRAVLLLGRVRRRDDSVRRTLRRKMRQLLREERIAGRSGEQNRRALVERLQGADGAGRTDEATVVARWPTAHRPVDSLASWKAKPGLAGRELPAALRDRVLGRLEDWARQRYGDLSKPHATEEAYELQRIDLGKLS
jgi:hypothetical protein